MAVRWKKAILPRSLRPFLVAPILERVWQVSSGQGVNVMRMQGQTMTMPLPPAGGRTAVVVYQDGKPRIKLPPAGVVEVMLLARDHPHPLVNVGGVELSLDPEVMPANLTCAAEDLMRVWFTADFPYPEGGSGSMTGTIGLYIVNEDLMTGTMEMRGSAKGAEMTARRLVTFRRAQ